MRTLYIYVDGSDLHDQEMLLVSEFEALARRWSGLNVIVVNQRGEHTPDMLPDDLPDWDLGVNIPLDRFGKNHAEELVPFLRNLAHSAGHEFVIGIGEPSGITDDMMFVDSASNEHAAEELWFRLNGEH